MGLCDQKDHVSDYDGLHRKMHEFRKANVTAISSDILSCMQTLFDSKSLPDFWTLIRSILDTQDLPPVTFSFRLCQ